MEKVEGRDTYKLKLTMKNGAALHVWIDAETFPEAKIEGQRCADLIQCDFRLGLKANLFGHFRLFPTLGIPGPFLRQVQAIADSRLASTSPPTGSPLPGSYLVSLLVRSIGARPPPNACPSSGSLCHPRSRQPLGHASASPVILVCVRAPVAFHRSKAPWPPNGVGTAASPERSQAPGGPPSARCSYAHRAGVARGSSSSAARAGLRAPRRSPGRPCMPRSVALVGLARRGMIPQNNSTSDCYFMTQ